MISTEIAKNILEVFVYINKSKNVHTRAHVFNILTKLAAIGKYRTGHKHGYTAKKEGKKGHLVKHFL